MHREGEHMGTHIIKLSKLSNHFPVCFSSIFTEALVYDPIKGKLRPLA